jgi:hypothetical protein
MKRMQLSDGLLLGRPSYTQSGRSRRFAMLITAAILCTLSITVPTVFLSSGGTQKPSGAAGQSVGQPSSLAPYVSQAVGFAQTKPLGEIKVEPLSHEAFEKIESKKEELEKNLNNVRRVKAPVDPNATGKFTDPAINNSKRPDVDPNTVTNPIQNFDGPDMDALVGIFGGRFAPPDTNAAVGPNHIVITTNSVVQVFNKSGTSLLGPVRISTFLAGIAGASSDDGDPIVLYDSLADRWLISEFDLTNITNNSSHEYIAISKTSDPLGAYYAYDFLLTPNRLGDYPHLGVWPDGYYMSTNDFNLSGTAFLGAGFYAFERAKMLTGDPTAKIIGFNSGTTDGGLLPTNLQGFTAPPVGTPNNFYEFFADEFGPPGDVLRVFEFRPNFANPPSSSLTQRPDIPVAAFDGRVPASRSNIEQPGTTTGLDAIADRLMHAVNFRVLAGSVQSFVLNWTVNVSGVNPIDQTTYQAGVRWMELRRNAGTGAITINQQATYAPGSGNPIGRDLWMASVAQDGEGNIGFAASASAPGPNPAALNPTAIYTGRLAGDPVNSLPQGEIDALSAVTRGSQTGTANRWGDYSSLFVDPADECTYWGAFEYVDAGIVSFDWNTRIFSFKVNPACATAARGTINGTITNCGTGQPIMNAIITTPDGFMRQTNASGQFSMTVAPGNYTVNVSGPAGSGFGNCTQTVTVATNGTATVNCCLAPSPIIVSAGATLVSESCTPANGVLDPNEVVTVSLCVQNTGGANTTALMGTLQATGGVTNIQAPNPQNYGVVAAGGAAVCRNFTFTVNGTCGGTVTATLQLQDGATNLGSLTYTFTLGVVNVAFMENFDGVTAPALPAGWATAFTNGDGDCTVGGALCTFGSNFTTLNSGSVDTAPNAAFHNDPSCVTNSSLDTPSINITTANAQLTFRNNYDMESTFDGAVLEVSSPNINGGAFTDITNPAVGGTFVSGAYNGTISAAFLCPLAGRQAWTGSSNGFITTVVNLGPNVAGQTIKIRFRFASDCSVSGVGWRIDTVKVTSGAVCSTQCVATGCTGITCPGNITQPNTPSQCGAVVSYPAPIPVGSGCGTITCAPPSGSFFATGTTTVTCQSSAGPTCSFTVTVNDTQPPTITCPTAVTAVTDQNCGASNCQVVNYTPPTVSDNCAGVTFVCSPPAGSCFATGSTTVTCTATDASGNTATCNFAVTVFDARIQDDSAPANVLLFNTTTGAYRFCCNGTVFTGTGRVKIQGCVFTLSEKGGRRIQATLNKSTHTGNASLEDSPRTTLCTLTDSNTLNDTSVCQ